MTTNTSSSAFHSTHVDTLAIHGGQHHDPLSGAVMPPIVLSSTFAQESPGKHKGFEYSRSGNPTRNALEACIAALEGGQHGLAYASGSAATTNVLHLLKPGDHVLCSEDVYGGTYRILDKIMKPMGIHVSFVDTTKLDLVRAAITPQTQMIWVETPSNPMLKITDLTALAALTHEAKAWLVVDNTFATPVLQKPLSLGATIVVHSTTKYLNGHSDVVGGAVVTSDDALATRLRFLQNAMGAVPGPFDSYMVLRGIKTLPVRMRQHVASAQTIAQRLTSHGQVSKVYYPGLETSLGYEIARRQMTGGPGGMISFVLKGSLQQAQVFLQSLRIFACAESLGGVESLAEHPAIMTHASMPADHRQALGIHDGLIRLSVGLEDVEDLWSDLEHAFHAAK